MYFIGIDIGTSAIKTVLTDENGRIVSKAQKAQEYDTPRQMWSEQAPELWWGIACDLIQAVIKEAGADKGEIKFIGVTGQMVGLVALDKYGDVIRPCILWNDQRSCGQAERLTEEIGYSTFVEITGNPAFATFVAPKIVWLRENEPGLYKKIEHIMMPKDYIVYKLTGEFTTDVTDASGTCLFDVNSRKWSSELISRMGISTEWIPKCLESGETAGSVNEATANRTGLSTKTLVCAGAGDQAAQALSCGIVRPNSCSITIGTSGVVYTATDSCINHTNGTVHSFCHCIPEMWALMGVMLSAGGAYSWLRKTLQSIDKSLSYKALDSYAYKSNPGSNDLLFLPYLTGERCPYDAPHAKACWLGLSASSTMADMIRSVLEGVAFGLKDLLNIISVLGIVTDKAIISGGAAGSSMWMQILSDIFDIPVYLTKNDGGAAYGAAILAGSAYGSYDNIVDAAKKMVETGRGFEPDKSKKGIYDDTYFKYRNSYKHLESYFEEANYENMRK